MPSSTTPLTLLQLPGDLLCKIVSQLAPEDLISTAISCKILHDFCRDNGDLERHSSRKETYVDINIGDPIPDTLQMDPLTLLEAINQDCHIVYYMRSLNINLDSWRRPGAQLTRKSRGDLTYLISTLKGPEEAFFALLALLIQCLPNITRLTIWDSIGDYYGFDHNSIRNKATGLEVWRLPHENSAPSNLQVIEVRNATPITQDDMSLDAKSVTFFEAFGGWLQSQSVTTLRARNVHFASMSSMDYSSDPFSSTNYITTLELTDCPLTGSSLARI